MNVTTDFESCMAPIKASLIQKNVGVLVGLLEGISGKYLQMEGRQRYEVVDNWSTIASTLENICGTACLEDVLDLALIGRIVIYFVEKVEVADLNRGRSEGQEVMVLNY